MKKILWFTFCLSLAFSLSAQEKGNSPLWLRHQQISPNGNSIAFCYEGDIYTVPTNGGVATRITANPAYDTNPIWSPDGSKIVFNSNREGSDDIYIVSSKGGNPTRLTFSSGSETPNTFLNDSTILFNAYVMPDKNFDMFPSPMFTQVYSISTKGGRPILYSSYPMLMISANKNGELLYTDKKGYENIYRKHEKASVCRDIWIRNRDGKTFKKLTNFKGEDRNAVFSPDGKGFYYLSERNGTYNIYYRDSINSDKDIQITNYDKNPVRFLSIARNGLLCYGYDGEIYTINPKTKVSKKVPISIFADNKGRAIIPRKLSTGITDFALSPNEKEVAFIIHGDVYVANIEYGTTKRITNTAEQERNLSFSPDGRKLMYSAERNGFWNIYISELVDKKDKLFCYANDIKEKQITNSQTLPIFQASFSPDGKEIAFLRNRTEIVGKDLKTGKEWVIMPGKYEYSYMDGDQRFSWSPDGKWILTRFIGDGGWNNQDIAIFSSDGSGKYTDLTESGYSESDAKWVLGGKAILFTSDRKGMRSHGSWGSQDDIYIMYLNADEYDKMKRTKEERDIEKQEKEDADKESSTKGKDSKSKKKEKKDSVSKVKPVVFDLDNRDIRTKRLTLASGAIGDMAMNNDGTKLYYIASYDNDTNLWVLNLDNMSSKILVKNISNGILSMSKDGNTLYLSSYGGISKISSDGTSKPINISADFELKPDKERAYIFSHTWQQVKDKFYDPKLHGVNWEYYKKVYEKFLPYINNDIDFAELLSEMLGELNASHTGAIARTANTARRTAALGAFFNQDYKGNGIMIDEILPSGPLDKADKPFKKGMIITEIDGKKIKAYEPIEPLLNGKIGDRVVIKVLDPSTKKTFEKTIKPISLASQRELLYRRWLKQREEKVKKWSNGRIAYVYVREMNSPSFRTVFQDLLGKYRNCDAAIVDTRYNGGGWLHDDLVILLSGKHSIRYTPRGQYVGSDPFMQWCKPSCVLQSEGNYSNGHGFPWLYQYLHMGKLIGTPVPGTMTAVWWENQINPSIVFGIPQVTCQDMQGHVLENRELEPDILVYNTPEDYIAGRDPQLKRAVEEMLKETEHRGK